MGHAVRRGALLGLAILLAVGTVVWVSRSSTWQPRAAAADVEALATAAREAAERIRRNQTAAGHWPTAVTPGLAFTRPDSEINVFVPAVIVDLLEPIATDVGLAAVVARARQWLAAQIEPTGLVRYHGAPGPVANPGCELPPDSDDTALVWRLAPGPDPSLRESARRTVEQYRTDAGLYRVWLAPDEAYRCFYTRFSGREWNPADVAVQMHIHLLFARDDPEAARRLCAALGPRMADAALWVYYEAAPFIPRLREVDLALAGCPLRVPDARLRDQPPGQEPYLRLAGLRRQLLAGDGGDGARAAIRETLGRLAADGFAAVETSPPLVYHNDLTATPPHFHWSTDVGYALWLRAYVETLQRTGPGARRR